MTIGNYWHGHPLSRRCNTFAKHDPYQDCIKANVQQKGFRVEIGTPCWYYNVVDSMCCSLKTHNHPFVGTGISQVKKMVPRPIPGIPLHCYPCGLSKPVTITNDTLDLL